MGSMMGGGGSTTERTVQGPPIANPPSLLPEAKPGFEEAQAFYRSVLDQPPVYGGPRVAGVPESIQTGLGDLRDIGEGGPSPEEMAGRNLNFTTTSGGSLAANPYASVYDVVDSRLTNWDPSVNPYVTEADRIDPMLREFSSGIYTDINRNPFFAGAQRNILDPILERYNTQIRPNIRDRFVTAGGEGSSREVLSEEQALREFGRSSTDALAQWEAAVYENERALQQRSAEQISAQRLAERGRAGGAFGVERGLEERAAEVASGLQAGELSRAGSVYNLERALQEEASKRGGMGTLMDIMRANTLIGAGTQERAFEQEQLGSMRELFEEPIYRQSAAAQSLMQAPTSAGYPGSSKKTSGEEQGAMGTLQSLGQLALTAAMIYALV